MNALETENKDLLRMLTNCKTGREQLRVTVNDLVYQLEKGNGCECDRSYECNHCRAIARAKSEVKFA